MSKYDLSILIPARSEMFLAKTVKDILKNIRGNTEIIIGLDGEFTNPAIEDNKNITIFYVPKSLGQRAITKQCARLSRSRYLLKCDAHCSFDEGFDVKLMANMQDDWTVVPIMKNLWAFDWKCMKCGKKTYQGPTPQKCENCNNTTNFKRKIMWISKKAPQSVSYCFDSQPHFQYFKEYAKRPEYKKMLEETGMTETMSLQGSLWMLTREKYFDLDMDDESFGSWGSQGLTIAIKTWTSGGKVMVNHNTWYSHLFRTQGKDFGFPYPQSGRQVQNAKKYAKDLFFNNKWPLQVKPLSWVLDKFKPINGWTEKEREEQKEREKNHPKFGINAKKEYSKFEKEMGYTDLDRMGYTNLNRSWKGESLKKEKSVIKDSKGIIYYTDNQLQLKIAKTVQKNLKKISEEKNIPIVSVSLKPMPHFGKNIHMKEKRGKLTMFKQILAALEASTADIIFHTEHDCLYPQEHFDFVPPKKDTFYYNLNVIKIDVANGQTLKVDVCRQVSGLCAYRELLIEEYKNRVKVVEENGYSGNMGYEAGTKSIKKGGFSDYGSEDWSSEVPILDFRHSNNLTKNRFSKDQFRNQKNTEGWTEGNYKDIKDWDISILDKIINR